VTTDKYQHPSASQYHTAKVTTAINLANNQTATITTLALLTSAEAPCFCLPVGQPTVQETADGHMLASLARHHVQPAEVQ